MFSRLGCCGKWFQIFSSTLLIFGNILFVVKLAGCSWFSSQLLDQQQHTYIHTYIQLERIKTSFIRVNNSRSFVRCWCGARWPRQFCQLNTTVVVHTLLHLSLCSYPVWAVMAEWVPPVQNDRSRKSSALVLSCSLFGFGSLLLAVCLLGPVVGVPRPHHHQDQEDRRLFPHYPVMGEKTSDVFITVKTSARFHKSRIASILDTWFQLAPGDIFFITDQDDKHLSRRTGEHVIATQCRASHSLLGLCCKMGVEFDSYIRSKRNWFCHFDDDNYVNVPLLKKLLSKYNPDKDWYLGKPSTKMPVHHPDDKNEPRKFWFATGGAGFCLSRSLAKKLAPLAADGQFVQVCRRLSLPDDVSMGFLISHTLATNLTIVKQFHSHLEPLYTLDHGQLAEQVSLSRGVNVPSIFDNDPSHFKSLHCLLYPQASLCLKTTQSSDSS
ncbi:Fringe glycosyltransferase [Trichinella nativa]|uniref:Fringe glycosyltransferase n=1 Tax=Trichinella nativa TaxID=6335 RepID=A0A0V1LP58_9BILA|nr:Fringe glycosyltransferase [Trichinella nativa]